MKKKRKFRQIGAAKIAALSPLEREALYDIKSGKSTLNEAISSIIKRIVEASLEAEMDAHLTDDSREDFEENRRNGKGSKTVKGSLGEFELFTPRDRTGSFEPQFIKKRQTSISEEIEAKILSLFCHGMSYSDIRDSISELYKTEVSNGTVNKITDSLLPEIKEWRERPLDSVYAILFLDAIHFKVKEEGRVISKAIYTLLGINLEGKKEILGLYINNSEGANYWASVLSSIKERGVNDILIACTDNLKGFSQAINSIFPNTEIQKCVIHQIRNSIKYVASKDQKLFMSDLKSVYRADSLESAEDNLHLLTEKWGKKYAMACQSWHSNWHEISNFFKFDTQVRKIIYTTNIVEGLHRMVRKYTKSKGAFSSENALVKLVYAAYNKASAKWTMPIQNWPTIVSQLVIHFPGRIEVQ